MYISNQFIFTLSLYPFLCFFPLFIRPFALPIFLMGIIGVIGFPSLLGSTLSSLCHSLSCYNFAGKTNSRKIKRI